MRVIRNEISLNLWQFWHSWQLWQSTGCLLKSQPDPSRFQQADENPDSEVEVLGYGVARGLGKRDAATAKVDIERTLLRHHLGGQGTVENSNEHA